MKLIKLSNSLDRLFNEFDRKGEFAYNYIIIN